MVWDKKLLNYKFGRYTWLQIDDDYCLDLIPLGVICESKTSYMP